MAPDPGRLVVCVSGRSVREPDELTAEVGRIGQHRVLAGAKDGYLLLLGDLLQTLQHVPAVHVSEAVAKLVLAALLADARTTGRILVLDELGSRAP